jgi:ATP-dependent DNA ligase
MMVIREQDHVRLISWGGHDWARQFPLIVEAALKLHQKHFVIDGEVVVLDRDGVSDFDALASRKHDKRALCLRHARRRRRGSSSAAALAAHTGESLKSRTQW